jgi:hypothetical protein
MADTGEVFVCDVDGTVTTLYSDELIDLGALEISRASNVEPNPNGTWYVELTNNPLNGNHAGKRIGDGFKTREEAIQFEVNWINKNILAPTERE